ncbi:MAG: hypothetical protein KF894_10150 [Labilithrix sp.]|nr:hypothetical protein [Labilithrix sp.]
MKTTTMFLAGALTLMTIATAGCKKKEDASELAPKPSAAETVTTSASAPEPKAAAAAAGGDSKCAALGCSGTGTFFDRCGCAAKPQPVPLTAKPTGKYTFNQPEWEVTNTTDKDLHWASAVVYYYDKAGNQLESVIKDKPYKASRMNGSSFTLKPNETKKVTIGFKKESEPRGAASMEIVFDGWCYGAYKDESSHLCISAGRAPDERARSGS